MYPKENTPEDDISATNKLDQTLVAQGCICPCDNNHLIMVVSGIDKNFPACKLDL